MKQGDVVLSRFEVGERVAAGGMGVVHRAIDRNTGATVALKVAITEDGVARASREADTLRAIAHAGVVGYVDHGGYEGELVLAMEWLEGESLANRLARAPLEMDEAIDIARQVALALGAVHRKGVVHRDIKPSNIILCKDGDGKLLIKLIDFGVARPSGNTEITIAGLLVGTPSYMSPEQARSSDAVDARADVFALGCVLFKCLTGRPPFPGDGTVAVLAKILLEDPPLLRQMRPDAPAWLESLVASMLSKDRDGRPRDGAHVAELLAGLPGGSASSLPKRAAMLTRAEQRVASVIVIAPRARKGSNVPSALTPSSAQTPVREAVFAVASSFGAHAERLVNGSIVLALFGQKSAVDLATRAAHCALACLAARPDATIALATGRGQVSGTTVVGEVIEQAVNVATLAASAETTTGQAGVAVDSVTAALLERRFEVALEAGGHFIACERDVTDAARTLLGRATPCVGRDHEMRLLNGLFAECASEERAELVLVLGPPGVGKSRLAHEWIRRLRTQEQAVECWIARGDSVSGSAASLGIAAQLLRQAFGGAQQAHVSDRVSRVLAPDRAPRVAEFLGEVMGARFPESPQLRAARADARLMGDQVRRSFVEWLRAECAQAPLLVVLEDLHWADPPSVKLLGEALRDLATSAPLFVLVLGRPDAEVMFPALTSRAAQIVRLGDLPRRAAETLVRGALGPSATPELVAKVVARSNGNPLFLEEILRAHDHRGADAEGRDEVPDTVLAMMQARLEAIADDERRAMRAASVFGETFWEGGVAALLGGESTHADVRRWLDALCEREVIARQSSSRLGAEAQLVFRHALVRDAAYAMLTEADRVTGHQLAAQWLENAGTVDAAELAGHWERTNETERAAPYYVAAAEAAMANDLDGAAKLAERSLACAKDDHARGRALVLLGVIHSWGGDFPRSLEFARQGQALAVRGSVHWYEGVSRLAVAAMRLGAKSEMVLAKELLLAAPAVPGAELARLSAFARVASQLTYASLGEEAKPLLDVTDAVDLEALGDDPARPPIQSTRAENALHEGDLGTYVHHMAAIWDIYVRIGDARNAEWARGNIAWAYMMLGAYPQAEEILRATLAESTQLGAEAQATIALHNLGFVLARRGRLEEARDASARAFEQNLAQGNRAMATQAEIHLAEALWRLGDFDGAEGHARNVADQTLTPARRPYAFALLARIRVDQGRAAEAVALAARAHEATEPSEWDEAESFTALAEVLALDAHGEHERAKERAAAAQRRLFERASCIRDEALRRSFLERVEENVMLVRFASS